MAESELDNVNKNSERRPTYGWIWAVVVMLLIIALFVVFGGLNWFSNSSPAASPSVPESVDVQPPPIQSQ
jgi:hypothetical protein